MPPNNMIDEAKRKRIFFGWHFTLLERILIVPKYLLHLKFKEIGVLHFVSTRVLSSDKLGNHAKKQTLTFLN